jgi:Uncharacterized protein conserved in bacteria
MFVVLLEYTRPLDEVDAQIPAHRAFLEQQYAIGHFLLSGRKEPRTGGVILATMASKLQLEQLLKEDPFAQAGVAEYQIIEFIPTMTAPDLAAYQQA